MVTATDSGPQAGLALITGAAGSIGKALIVRLPGCIPTDVFWHQRGLGLDVTDEAEVDEWVVRHRPRLIYHLAAAKSAPAGELDPFGAAAVNVAGTRNVLRAAAQVGARVVTASTCKAADPETAYGASKLLAERMTLAAGGWVARFYNVRESAGNVFAIWRLIDETEPLPVALAQRYFISLNQAVNLLLRVPGLPPGRYTVDPGPPQSMGAVARETWPGRARAPMRLRRGDRRSEPLCARSETLERLDGGLVRIRCVHDAPDRDSLLVRRSPVAAGRMR